MPPKKSADDKTVQNKNTFAQRLKDDGVVNPAGFATFGATFVFLALAPVTVWVTQPNSAIERLVNGICSGVAFIGSAGASTQVAQTGKIAALSTLYIATTFGLTGAGCAAGVDAGSEGGRSNNHPRAQERSLSGLPLRLSSAHHQMVEMFGGFALAAALTQAMAPGDQGLINLLGLHVLSKVFVYYPAYIYNIGLARTFSHVVATASVIGVGLQLSKRPLI